jgi:DNA gyrase subunit A
MAVKPGEQLMIMTKNGTVVRTPVDGIRSTGRAAQGVTIINIEAGDLVTGVAHCPQDEDDGSEPKA